jgi:hypothetical protein
VIQLTHFAKTGGPLTKRISLAADGSLRSDGSECIMRKGTAKRVVCATLHEFAAGISEYCSHEAVALGALRSDLPDEVQIITKSRLEKLNSSAANNVIARTNDHILYRAGQPALALIDIDTKGMPATVRDRIKDQGGYWAALASVVPELEHTARVERHSTTTGISRADTGEQFPGSDGEHIFPLVQDGADIERFLRTLHDRCWLACFGWFIVGIGGQLLERSIVDRMVYAPERLVFEGAPVLDPPLLQDLASRKATVTDGAPLDTVAACPPLRIVEQDKLRELKAKEAHRLAPDRAKAHKRFVLEQAEHIVAKTGMAPDAARRTVEQQCVGVLLPAVVLPFDGEDMRCCTVADVLADPDRFVGATLADPLEGVEYGVCKAKVMQRPDGTLWVHSFAHGRTVYDLKYDADAIAVFIAKAADAEAIDVLARLVATADVSDHDLDQLVVAAVARLTIESLSITRDSTS